jgi:hypothetical protein
MRYEIFTDECGLARKAAEGVLVPGRGLLLGRILQGINGLVEGRRQLPPELPPTGCVLKTVFLLSA